MSTESLDQLQYTIEGNADGATLLFIHGWPDSAELWRHQVEKLKNDYCCVLVTLPNFEDRIDEPGGYDFPALLEMLGHTIDDVLPDPDQKLVFITHDWGAYIGYLYEQTSPQRVRAMVSMDIGGHFKATSVKSTLMILSYQWALTLSWLVGRPTPGIGDWMTRQVARVIGVPARQLAGARARYNYLYYYFWRAMLRPSARGSLLARYRPQCPVLFLYGENKPVMFHSERWLKIVAETGGLNHGVGGAGHWFMESHPDEVNEIIAKWGQVNFT